MAAPVQDITSLLTPYLLHSLISLQRCYGTSPQVIEMCRSLSDTHVSLASSGVSFRAVTPLEEYDMLTTTINNPLPTSLPFIQDFCATYIPRDTKVPAWSSPDCYSGGYSVMDDIVEAIRQKTTSLIVDGRTRWMPPTTQDIQQYMSFAWPQKYRSDVGDAKGWKNTVNQCLTHGQGWNFVTYVPQTGKNKRHCLVERAFNGVCVLGSGVCKGLNDRKPKRPRHFSTPANAAVLPAAAEPAASFTALPLSLDSVATPANTYTTFTTDTNLPNISTDYTQDEEVVDYSQYLNASELVSIPEFMWNWDIRDTEGLQ